MAAAGGGPLYELGAVQMRELLRSGKTTSAALVESCLQRVAQRGAVPPTRPPLRHFPRHLNPHRTTPSPP